MNQHPASIVGRLDGQGIATRLREARLAKGWALSYVAQLAGTSQIVVERAEVGVFSAVNLQRIVNALGADLDYIAWGEKP